MINKHGQNTSYNEVLITKDKESKGLMMEVLDFSKTITLFAFA